MHQTGQRASLSRKSTPASASEKYCLRQERILFDPNLSSVLQKVHDNLRQACRIQKAASGTSRQGLHVWVANQTVPKCCWGSDHMGSLMQMKRQAETDMQVKTMEHIYRQEEAHAAHMAGTSLCHRVSYRKFATWYAGSGRP